MPELRRAAARAGAVLAEALEARQFLTATVDYVPQVGQPVRYTAPTKGVVSTADFTPAPRWLVDEMSRASDYDIFFRLDGVQGESADQGHQGWLDIESFNFLGDQTPATSTTSVDSYHEIHLAGPLSKGSPRLMQLVEEGRSVPDGDIAFRRPGEDFDFLQIDLNSVIVSSHRLTTVGPVAQGLPTEEFTLNYSALRAVYTPSEGSGPGTPIEYLLGFDKGEAPEFSVPRQRSLIHSGDNIELAPGLDLFLRLDNIAGEVAEPAYARWIRASGFEWGLYTPPGLGRTRLFELRVVGEVDASTPKLLEASTRATRIPTGDLVLARRDGVDPFEAIHLDLGEVRVTSHVSSTLPDGKVRQEFTLGFSQVALDYKQTPTANPVRYQLDGSRFGLLVDSFVPDQRPLIGLRDNAPAVPGGAGEEMFLNLTGIAGDVDVPGYVGAIKVLDYEWVTQGAIPSPTGGTSPPRFGEIHFLVDTSKASPPLLEALRTGQVIADAKLTLTQPSPTGIPAERQRLTLDNAIVTSYQTTARGDRGVPYEEFTLSYNAIDYRYSVRDENGEVKQTVTFVQSLSKGGTIVHAPPTQRALLDGNPAPGDHMFLRLDNVKGEVTIPAYKDWLAVDGYGWTINRPPGALGATLGSFHVTSRVSRATPFLFDRLVKGTNSPTARLVLVRDDPASGGPGEVALQYDFGAVQFDSWRLVTDDNGDVREEFTLSYDRAVVAYTPPGGAALPATTFSKLVVQPFVPTQPSILLKEEEEEKGPPPKKVDEYLDLEGVEGESTDEGHKEEIEIYSFSFGARRPGLQSPVVFEVRAAGGADKSAPRLMQSLAEGRPVPDAVISVRRPGEPGEPGFDFLKLTLQNARLTSYLVHATDGLEQEIGLTYTDVEVRYTPEISEGVPGTPVFAAYTLDKLGAAPVEAHPPQRSLLLPAVQSGASAPPLPMFLRLNGIPAEARDPGHGQWIPILGYEWLHDYVGVAPSGGIRFSEFHFVSEMSKATPLLLQHMRDDRNISSATLAIGRPSAQGGAQDFYFLNLGAARVTSHRVGTFASAGAPLEEFTLTLGTDTTAPVVTAARFENATRQQVVTTFSEDVSRGLSVADVQVKNMNTGLLLPATDVARAYDLTTNTATWTFPNHPGGLPDANWSFTLLASSVNDAAGNDLTANSVVDFFSLAGDANGDRTVGFADLVALAQNYGTGGKTFAQGNFNYDPAGNVDFADLVILAQRYNTTLPAPPPPVPAAASAEVSAPVRSTAARTLPVRSAVRPADPMDLLRSAAAPIFSSVRVVPPRPKARKIRA